MCLFIIICQSFIFGFVFPQTVLEVPTSPEDLLFSTAYNYCTNWCVDFAGSIFSHRDDEPFSEIDRCDEPYVNKIESQVANPPQHLIDICGESLECIVDGLCGGDDDANSALNNYWSIRSEQEQKNPMVRQHFSAITQPLLE